MILSRQSRAERSSYKGRERIPKRKESDKTGTTDDETGTDRLPKGRNDQDRRYLEVAAEFGPALDRLARGYEADPDLRRDLRQEIHTELWKSLARFDGRCSLRTWVYRVAHNTAASHVLKHKSKGSFVGLEELEVVSSDDDPERALAERDARQRLLALVQTLKPADRQLTLLYLEDLDAAAIGEVTGLSSGAIAVKIHRIKAALAARFNQAPHNQGGSDGR
jgi:RNA polymerase sigma-70 factor (ECF subfamily)